MGNRISVIPTEYAIGRRQTADFLMLSVYALDKLRTTNHGPKWHRQGRKILYDIRQVASWLVSYHPSSLASVGSSSIRQPLVLTHDENKRLRLARKKSRYLQQVLASAKRPFLRSLRLKRYLASHDVRLVAAVRALRRSGNRRTGIAQDLAEQIEPGFICSETVKLKLKLRPGRTPRRVFEFGPLATARQLVVLDALKALCPLPPFQFDQAGKGVNAAIGEILRLAKENHPFFLVADIADCFSSFDKARIMNILPLPKEVTRHTVLASNLEQDRPSHVPTNRMGPVDAQAGYPRPRLSSGLPQGCATSNYVAGILLSDLIGTIGSSSSMIMYRDDIVVLSTSALEISVTNKALSDALQTHRAGRLRLRDIKTGDLRTDGFAFLGYHLMHSPSGPVARPSAKNQAKLYKAYSEALAVDIDNGDLDASETVAAIECRLRAFPHWDEKEEVRDALIAEARLRVVDSLHGSDAEC